MVVGVCRLSLALSDVSSLKGKRSIVRSVVEKTRHRFNAAVAEVSAQDDLDRAVVGFSVTSNDARHAQEMLDSVVSFVSQLGLAPVSGRFSEIVHFNDDPREEGDVLGSWADYE